MLSADPEIWLGNLASLNLKHSTFFGARDEFDRISSFASNEASAFRLGGGVIEFNPAFPSVIGAVNHAWVKGISFTWARLWPSSEEVWTCLRKVPSERM